MYLIKVKSNYGQHIGNRVVLRRPQDDKPFEIDDEKGQELIDRDIAELVSKIGEAGETEPSDEPNLADLKVTELKELAKSRGIEGAETMKKSELIEALSEGEEDTPPGPTGNPENGVE